MDARWSDLRKLAQRQSGVFTLDELIKVGFPPTTVWDLERRGQLIRVDPAVYAMAGTPITLSARETSALLRLGPSAVLSHLSAAASLHLLPPPSVPWVTIPSTHRAPARSEGLIVRRARVIESLSMGKGRRITPMPRTLVDLGQCLGDRELAAVYLTAMQRDGGMFARVSSELDRLGRGYSGVGRGRKVLGEFSPAMESILGAEGFSLLKPCLPSLALGCEVRCIDGVTRVCDLFVRELRLDVECDSWAFHGSKDQQTSDKRRDRMMAASGVQTVRLNTDDIRRSPVATIREVSAVAERRRRDLAA